MSLWGKVAYDNRAWKIYATYLYMVRFVALFTKTKIGSIGYNHRNQKSGLVIVKSVSGHPRMENERDVLKSFQARTPYSRPWVDEIQDPAEPTTIVLRHPDSDPLEASVQRPLNRKEMKYALKRILEALSVMHKDGYVHTDIQLGDLGGSYPRNSEWAKSGITIGAPIWSSPEVLMETPWNTATDIWSFGTVVISLLYGGDFNILCPKNVRYGDETYNLEIVKSQFRFFGPFPAKAREIFNDETLMSIVYTMEMILQDTMTSFRFVTEREVAKEDKDFVLKIMQMDWRDRPTAEELLRGEWFCTE
ncbi:STE/STE20 protein kinase [Xylaria grammica]|nr:STE/STE20 protein kinase [Xylaria grammica]